MHNSESRLLLAEKQSALVAALARGAPAPAGFDPRRVRQAAKALLRKRSSAAAKAFPRLARALGAVFDEHFACYAAIVPLGRNANPALDARSFARWLSAQGRLPDEGQLEALEFDLHFKQQDGTHAPRRGFALRVIRLKAARRLILGIRWPLLGIRTIRLPWIF
jgi:hypothetical protein